MRMCILAGFNLYNEPWVDGYLENPDFIEYTDYYVKKATSQDLNSNPVSSEENSDSEAAQLSRKSDQELNDLLNQDEYYFERFHKKSIKKKLKFEKIKKKIKLCLRCLRMKTRGIRVWLV